MAKVEFDESAEWLDMECPKCKQPFVAEDKWGKFCCFGPCDWAEDAPEETKDKRRAKPPKRDAVWLDMDCPRCGYRFVAQDKWGRYCCCGPCDWTDAPEETT